VSDVNNVTLIGRLTRDTDLRYTSSGKAVSKFSLAVNERRKAEDQWKDETNFFDIILWGQLAENLNQYLTKGKQIAVTGRLTQERWEQDGVNRSKVAVTAATVQLLGGASNGNGNTAQKQGAVSPPPDPPADDGFADDIPF
jgi:single-strand DNA-binding protein